MMPFPECDCDLQVQERIIFWSTGKRAWTVWQSGEHLIFALQGNSFGSEITASGAQMVSSTAYARPSRVVPF